MTIKCGVCKETIRIEDQCPTCEGRGYLATPEGHDQCCECNGSGKLIQIFECKCERENLNEITNQRSH